MSGAAGFWIGLGLFFGLDCLGVGIARGLIAIASELRKR